jgi:hypothetical protein
MTRLADFALGVVVYINQCINKHELVVIFE